MPKSVNSSDRLSSSDTDDDDDSDNSYGERLKATLDASKKSNVGSSSHFNEKVSYYDSDDEHLRKPEWDYQWRKPNSSISSAVGLSHIHRAYDEIQNSDLKLHLKASTISVKGVHFALHDVKQSHDSVKDKIEEFMLYVPKKDELKHVRNAIQDVKNSHTSLDA